MGYKQDISNSALTLCLSFAPATPYLLVVPAFFIDGLLRLAA